MSLIEIDVLEKMDRNSPEFRKAAEDFWNEFWNDPNFQEPLVTPGPIFQAWLDEVDQLPISSLERNKIILRASLDGTMRKLCQEDTKSIFSSKT